MQQVSDATPRRQLPAAGVPFKIICQRQRVLQTVAATISNTHATTTDMIQHPIRSLLPPASTSRYQQDAYAPMHGMLA